MRRPACVATALLAAVLVLRASADAVRDAAPDDRLIGWLGETYSPRHSQPGGDAADPSGMRVLSWEPRIMHYRRFLTTEECEHLKVKAAPRLARSDVADSVTGKQLVSNVRTSKGMFFTRNEDDIITRVEARVAAVTMLPPGHAESMQVLHYQSTEEYRPHHDYFSFEGRDANGGNRIATVLMYLTDVEAGGETVFPHVPRAPHQTMETGWSNCSMKMAPTLISQLCGPFWAPQMSLWAEM